MTELDFLLDLLLNHKLPKNTKQTIKDRIAIIQHPQLRQNRSLSIPPHALDGMENDPNRPPIPTMAGAVTPLAQKALMDRQKLIQDTLAGKEEPGRTSPRKF